MHGGEGILHDLFRGSQIRDQQGREPDQRGVVQLVQRRYHMADVEFPGVFWPVSATGLRPWLRAGRQVISPSGEGRPGLVLMVRTIVSWYRLLQGKCSRDSDTHMSQPPSDRQQLPGHKLTPSSVPASVSTAQAVRRNVRRRSRRPPCMPRQRAARFAKGSNRDKL